MKYPRTLPKAHQTLLTDIIAAISADTRFVGMYASGSYATDSMDEYSDLDLVLVANNADYQKVFAERFDIIQQISGVVAAFTGEHVGEPRLVISLFAPATVHVDFKFVTLEDAHQRVDDVTILWQRTDELTKALAQSTPFYPSPSPQWVEDRFWVWVHYGATKIARGEYFEAMDFIAYLRNTVLSPLTLKQNGLTPSGVRKIESRLPDFAQTLRKTVATPDKEPLIDALATCVVIYEGLREGQDIRLGEEARALSLEYFERELGRKV